jgi:DNA replication protein DnaC
MKQENAADNSDDIIHDIVNLFSVMHLPQMSDPKLFVGIPNESLNGILDRLNSQYNEDIDKRFCNRLRYAGIAKERTENTFYWDATTYPFIAPGQIEEVLSINFVRNHKNLIVVGPPGAGKTLLVLIVSCKALKEEFSVKYKTGHDISDELREARDGNSLSGYIRRMQSCDVLAIEDLSFATFEAKTSQDFFSIIDKRYGRKTTIITSNESLQELSKNFPDKKMHTALLGRFYEDAVVVNMNGAKDKRLEHAKEALGNLYDKSEAKGRDTHV